MGLCTYKLDGGIIDSIDLKAMIVAKGLKVDGDVYKRLGKEKRIHISPLCCNSFCLPDDTIVQMTDIKFHLGYLKTMFSWDTLKQLRYMSDMKTPFSISLDGEGEPYLLYNKQPLTKISFPEKTDFYKQKTASGLPYIGNAVIQGSQWLAFQCLWPCEYAIAGAPCQFCYSGGIYKSLKKKNKPFPALPSYEDAADMAEFIIKNTGYCDSIQITGGSCFDGAKECEMIKGYLDAIISRVGKPKGEILLYITPPADCSHLDSVFNAGADKIACSLEVWDEGLADTITPGKQKYTTRKRHLDALQYIADNHGKNKAFSNFIIGLEPLDSLIEGAEYLGSRGIIPAASVWIPFGSPVNGSMKTPSLEYFQEFKKAYANIYKKYGLIPAGGRGLNVCLEHDIYAHMDEVLSGAVRTAVK